MISAMMDWAAQSAQRLGLALVSPFFPSGTAGLSGQHCAMLDGRRASFACSTVDRLEISPDESRNWQWSADLAHHVLITPETVHVRSGRELVPREFQRESVESRLEEFLTFLDSPRRSALPDVVSFLVDEFQQIWGASGSPNGATALLPFLLALSANAPGNMDDPAWRHETALDIGIDDPVLLEANLNPLTIQRARGLQERAPSGLRLIPSLVLRHAAGRLFQEAHAILETTQLTLFGDFEITKTPTYSPAGAYFTPVPLARLLADWAFQRMTLPDDLTVADYACGSAVFLTEALRALERREFNGTVRLVGRDKSLEAVRMSKVAIRTAQRDLQRMTVVTDITQADAFQSDWPSADICLMNPPFRSWEGMNQAERSWVQEVTKSNGHGRPDLSVGFIERAMRALRPAGVLATLVPAGVLASDSLGKWRNEIAQRGTPTLVAVLGEHGLFEHALVNIGILCIQNGTPAEGANKTPVNVAWSSAESGAAARVIRAIRRSMSRPDRLDALRKDTDGWSVTTTNLEVWKRRPSWLPGAGALGALLETIEANTVTKVGDLFDVHQGIRTGANPIFMQPSGVVMDLPENERRYFKKAIDAASFVEGELKPEKFLFYAPKGTWKTEEELSQAVPQFFNRHIRPSRETLNKRKSMRSKTDRYWELAWERPRWAFKGHPRLVSKRFGLYPAFARDCDVAFAIVQANAWVPKDQLVGGFDKDKICELLTAYWWLLNSRVAVALFREFCPNVAGGQLDLENKYVKNVPMPNLPRQFSENPTLPVLANSIRSRYPNRLPAIPDRDHFAAAAFGTDISEWKLSGLEMQY